MTATAQLKQLTREIVVEDVLPHPPELVWQALTRSELISRWLMPNDFEAAVGRRFTFTTTPIGNWNGVVECEVLEVITNEKLVYTWKGGSDENSGYGGRLDSLVTFTLTPVAGGTRLRLVHSGFRSPDNDFAFDAMSRGWPGITQRIAAVASELAEPSRNA